MGLLGFLLTIAAASALQEFKEESSLDVYASNKQVFQNVDIYQGPVIVLAETTGDPYSRVIAYYADNGIRSIVDYENFQSLHEVLQSSPQVSGLVLSLQGLAGNDFLQLAVRDFVLPDNFKLYDLLRDNHYTVPVVYVAPKEDFKNRHFVGLYQVAKFVVKENNIDAVPFGEFDKVYNSSASFYPFNYQPSGYYPFNYQPSGYYPFNYQPSGNYPFNYQPSGNYPFNYQPSGNYPFNYQPSGNYPFDYQPSSYYPFNYQPSGYYPFNYQPSGNYPFNYQPSGNYPSNYQPSGYYPYNYQSSGYYPFNYQPSGYYPYNYQSSANYPFNYQPYGNYPFYSKSSGPFNSQDSFNSQFRDKYSSNYKYHSSRQLAFSPLQRLRSISQ